MPRYFFHVHDGIYSPDSSGTVIKDDETACQQAIQTTGTLLAYQKPNAPIGRVWGMIVVGPDEKVICTINVAIDRR
ncbi:DUF6894 family protein [Mesorhizobium liriopis]|uniref:DUF6894 family protein n=1 Tax=Mesorhizobium liriopis TaxID=2953882 RepID=UPI003EBFBB2D